MKIQSMFQKDINRDINGVGKVAQDDEKSLHQELSEYIINIPQSLLCTYNNHCIA